MAEPIDATTRIIARKAFAFLTMVRAAPTQTVHVATACEAWKDVYPEDTDHLFYLMVHALKCSGKLREGPIGFVRAVPLPSTEKH